jgi:hypothetical protein
MLQLESTVQFRWTVLHSTPFHSRLRFGEPKLNKLGSRAVRLYRKYILESKYVQKFKVVARLGTQPVSQLTAGA